jgi:hypothetical protein
MSSAVATAPVKSIDINPVSAMKYAKDVPDEREKFRQHLIAALWLPSSSISQWRKSM